MEFIHAFIGEVASGEQSLDVAAGKIFLSRTTCTVRVFSVSLLVHEQNQGWKGVVHGELTTAARMKVYWSTYYTYLASGGQISYTLNV